MQPVPRRRRDDGRGDVPRQHRDEGLPEEPGRHRARRSPAAGSTPATSRVLHPDGYIKLKDRSKDIIISGGENISSIEVEDVLYTPPGGAVPRRWSPSPTRSGARRRCAFVELRSPAPSAPRCRRADRALPRSTSRTSRCPRKIVFAELPEDVHRQDPEVRAARSRPDRQPRSSLTGAIRGNRHQGCEGMNDHSGASRNRCCSTNVRPRAS